MQLNNQKETWFKTDFKEAYSLKTYFNHVL